MRILPTDWSVIVLGRWNPAIVTPAWIRDEFFGLDKETVVELFVSLDEFVPVKVRYDGYTVQAGSGPLLVEFAGGDYERLGRALNMVKRAIDRLPRTPFFAVGINLAFQIQQPSDELLDTLQPELDGLIASAGHEIAARTLTRAIAYGEGAINLIVETPDPPEELKLVLNFERRSKQVESLVAWLSMPVSDIQREAVRLLSNVFGLEMENTDAT